MQVNYSMKHANMFILSDPTKADSDAIVMHGHIIVTYETNVFGDRTKVPHFSIPSPLPFLFSSPPLFLFFPLYAFIHFPPSTFFSPPSCIFIHPFPFIIHSPLPSPLPSPLWVRLQRCSQVYWFPLLSTLISFLPSFLSSFLFVFLCDHILSPTYPWQNVT